MVLYLLAVFYRIIANQGQKSEKAGSWDRAPIFIAPTIVWQSTRFT